MENNLFVGSGRQVLEINNSENNFFVGSGLQVLGTAPECIPLLFPRNFLIENILWNKFIPKSSVSCLT